MKLKSNAFCNRGFTFLEGLTTLIVLGSFAGLLFGFLIQANSPEKTAIVKVKYKYTQSMGESPSQKRVDVQFEDGCHSDVLIVENVWHFNSSVRNSATLYANLDVGETYELKIIGTRNSFWTNFPYVTSVTQLEREIDCPKSKIWLEK